MPKSNGKDAFYFPHDCNARNDNKVLAMRSVYGAEGYGLYWMLIEVLREQPDYKYPLGKFAFKSLAMDLHCDSTRLEEFVLNCCEEFKDDNSSLLKMDANYLWSDSLLCRMKSVDEVSSIRRESARKRWESRADANALQKESKIEQRRAENSRAEQNQNGAGAVAAAEERIFSLLFETYREQTGKLAGESQKRQLKEYADQLGAAVVLEAFRVSKERNVVNWSYTKRILQDWVELGIDSIEQVQAEQEKWKGANSPAARGAANVPSFDTPQYAENIKRDLDRMDRLFQGTEEDKQ